MMKATSSEKMPSLKKNHISTGAKPNTEPTDRSNSPDVISSVMARATMPSSGVNASRLPMLRVEAKAPFNSVKVMKAPTSSANGPASGAPISL